jgi:hypothetical protein
MPCESLTSSLLSWLASWSSSRVSIWIFTSILSWTY